MDTAVENEAREVGIDLALRSGQVDAASERRFQTLGADDLRAALSATAGLHVAKHFCGLAVESKAVLPDDVDRRLSSRSRLQTCPPWRDRRQTWRTWHGRLQACPAWQRRLARAVDPDSIFRTHQVNHLPGQRHAAPTHFCRLSSDVDLAWTSYAAAQLQRIPANANRLLARLGGARLVEANVAANHQVLEFHHLALADDLHLNQIAGQVEFLQARRADCPLVWTSRRQADALKVWSLGNGEARAKGPTNGRGDEHVNDDNGRTLTTGQ